MEKSVTCFHQKTKVHNTWCNSGFEVGIRIWSNIVRVSSGIHTAPPLHQIPKNFTLGAGGCTFSGEICRPSPSRCLMTGLRFAN